MVSDNQQSEALELTPMTINDTQDDQSFTEEASIVDDELQREVLVADKRQQQLLHTSWSYYACHVPTSKRFCTILLLILTISTSVVVLVGHYTKNHGEEIAIKYNVEKVGSPEKIGHFNIYIRESIYNDLRRPLQQLRYPAAVYSRNRLPLNSPFINYQLTMPIFTHPATRQTIVFSPNGLIYLFPKFYNAYGQVFSLGELLASGYASFISNSFGMPAFVDIATVFRPVILTGSRIPTIDSSTGGFRHGIHTKYRSMFASRFPRTPIYEKNPSFEQRNTNDNQLSSYKSRNPYYKKQPSYKEKSTTQSTTQITGSTFRPIITQYQPAASTNVTNKNRASKTKFRHSKVNPRSASNGTRGRVLLKNAYLVEFALNANVKDHFRTITNSLMASHGIDESAVKQRHIIQSSLFSGISFSLIVEHPTEALEMIEEAVAIYPIYTVRVPQPNKNNVSPKLLNNNSVDFINSHGLTGVTQVHNELHNFGKGVRVAVIDTGVYYLHPALGGCFGPGCKVGFGYDLVGDEYDGFNAPVPDNDPLDNCSSDSHGTHVSGIIAANITGINQAVFIPDVPFIGVAPQVTLGAYRVFGCNGDVSTDVITAAIYRAYDDKADIITMSLGDGDPYPESSDVIAVQRVTEAGVYVTVANGNDGDSGLQTVGNPGDAPNAVAVASVDNKYPTFAIIIAPSGKKIPYLAGVAFGGWQSIVNSTIVVNDPNRATSDGCSGPSKPVSGVVVLFYYSNEDSCGSAVRCNKAAAAGAAGCLLYNVGAITGSSSIPSGSLVNLQDGFDIVTTVTANPSAIYTFTNLIEPTVSETGGTLSFFTSFGLTGDLWLKPQISGIGGNVYSTISSYAAQQEHLTKAYATYSGTSMACPYTAGALALFLSSIKNPAPDTVNGHANNGTCRPKFSIATNIFQSSAMPLKIYNSSLFATAAQQGAGLVNAYQALTITTIFSPSELSLNDTVRKAKSYTVNLLNIGDKAGVYKITHGGAALVTGKAPNDDQLLSTPLFSADYADVQIEPTEFKLDSGKSRKITLRFRAPASANPALLPIYSGFIYATNTMNGQVVHLSYAGVVGNYADARIIVRNASSGIITGIRDSNFNYVTNQQLPTLDATEGFYILAVIAWSTRILFVEVISAQKNDSLSGSYFSYGLAYSSFDGGAFYLTSVSRNVVSPLAQSFSQYYAIFWNGYVCPTILGGNCADSQSNTIPPGEYKIRYSALKHFGNDMNPNDFDVYITPPFKLVY